MEIADGDCVNCMLIPAYADVCFRVFCSLPTGWIPAKDVLLFCSLLHGQI